MEVRLVLILAPQVHISQVLSELLQLIDAVSAKLLLDVRQLHRHLESCFELVWIRLQSLQHFHLVELELLVVVSIECMMVMLIAILVWIELFFFIVVELFFVDLLLGLLFLGLEAPSFE